MLNHIHGVKSSGDCPGRETARLYCLATAVAASCMCNMANALLCMKRIPMVRYYDSVTHMQFNIQYVVTNWLIKVLTFSVFYQRIQAENFCNCLPPCAMCSMFWQEVRSGHVRRLTFVLIGPCIYTFGSEIFIVAMQQ